jgi:ribulose-phosphate 3-epimerase
VIVAPSILACDLGRLADEIRAVERGGARMIHVDVMDGRFVPNITFGPVVVKACRQATKLPVDAHLMVADAEPYLDAFADAGATSISVHVEAVTHLQRAIAHLRERKVSPGVALNPATPLSAIEEILPELDYVLVMSVNPGFSGQTFIPHSLDKLKRVRSVLEGAGSTALIEIDGGIDQTNVSDVVAAGANILVAGQAIFGSADPEAATRALRASANQLVGG